MSVCVYCAANALDDTTTSSIFMLDEISNDIDEYLASLDLTIGENRAFATLLGRCNAISSELMGNILNDTSISLTTWASVTRSFLETCADLGYMFTGSRSQEYTTEFLHIYGHSTYDLKDLALSPDLTELSKIWRKQKWSKASYEDKLGKIFGGEFCALYGYCSRLVHGVNRDGSFREHANTILVRMYVFYEALLGYCEVVKLIEDRTDKSIVSKVQIMSEAIRSAWQTRNENLASILYLTTFFDDSRSEHENEAVMAYRARLKEAFEKQTRLPSYEFIDHREDTRHIKVFHTI
jgi:hypothetical protein